MVEAIILSAGLGTRVKTVIGSLPKAMIPINGRPLLYHMVVLARRLDVHRFIIVLSPRDVLEFTRSVQNFFSTFNIEIVPVVQDAPRGPGDAMRCAVERRFTSPKSRSMIVLVRTVFQCSFGKE